jgi:hypothetical protein
MSVRLRLRLSERPQGCRGAKTEHEKLLGMALQIRAHLALRRVDFPEREHVLAGDHNDMISGFMSELDLRAPCIVETRTKGGDLSRLQSHQRPHL